MAVITRLFLLALVLQAEIHLGFSSIQHFAQSFSRCFPYDFNQNAEIRNFDSLLVIPRLATHSLRDLSHYDIAPENNMRYNEFLSCVWKDRGFQKQDGTIDFHAVENALANAIGRDAGYTGSGINSSRTAASRIVSGCQNLRGLTHGHKAVLVRNCVLTNIKNSSRF